MKKLILILLFGFIICVDGFAAQTITVKVNGMVCDFCARALEKTFNKQDSVASIDVDLTAKVVTIALNDGAALDDDTVTTLVTNAGYNVESIDRK